MILESFSIDYPANFYIQSKYGHDFSLVNKQWEGYGTYDASVGVQVYEGDVPGGMKLREWLDKVSTSKRQDTSGDDLSCKFSKQFLRDEIAKTPYGGDDDKLSGDSCLYYGVTKIREAELPKIKSSPRLPANLEILEFDSSDSSYEEISPEDKHTLIYFGTGSVFDIYKSQKDPYADHSGAEEAYKALKDSFKLRD